MNAFPALDTGKTGIRDLGAKINLANGLVGVALVGLALLLGIQIWQSMQWRMVHDSAIVHYGAFLIDRHGFVPYKDLVDTVLPGSYLFHMTIGQLFGYGDEAFRLVDTVLLLALLTVTWLVQRPLGKLVAWSATLIFGLLYLSYGPSMSLQRDYLGLLPIALALWIASRGTPQPRSGVGVGRFLLIGALFGVACSFKPHLVVGLPAIVLLAVANDRDGREPRMTWFAALLAVSVPVVLGLLVVVAVPILWLWGRGGLPAFWVIMSQYLPLYLRLDGEFRALGQTDRLISSLTSFQDLAGRGVLLAPAALGGYLALFESGLSARNKRLVMTILALVALYSIYPVISGQFWNYHWMPFIYFAALGASLLLVPLAGVGQTTARQLFVATIFVLGVALIVRPAPDFYRQLAGNEPRPPKDGRVDEIATFLRQELRPGDRVQPLDFVSGGTNQAMLLADAVIATRYQFDSLLYHDVSSPYIQARQQDFLAQLAARPPRFIIEYPDRPRPTGLDTIQNLPELDHFVARHYSVVQEGSGYLIYERTQ